MWLYSKAAAKLSLYKLFRKNEMRYEKMNLFTNGWKKVLAILCAFLIIMSTVSCSSKNDITVISREEGSGTRSAFVELLDIVDENGNDAIHLGCEFYDATATVLAKVNGNKNSIGYVSLGSLSSDVKAVKIDGVAATAENVENGRYKISRPFLLVTKGDEALSELEKDFIKYILSDEGQAVVARKGYITVAANGKYTASQLQGTIKISGSTSVDPVMQELAYTYMQFNSDVSIEIQSNGSSAGISDVLDGKSGIGMSSRELKDSEISKGAVATRLATDGIAVIVNNLNSVDNLSAEDIKNIYTGKITSWDEFTD